MSSIIKSLHVAILVSDLARAQRFYGDVLQLPIAARSLSFPGLWFQVGDFQLHLMELETWQAPCPRPEKWGRNPHVAFQVTELAPIKQRLLAHNSSVQMSTSGRAALFTQDPDGNIIELSQIAPSPEAVTTAHNASGRN
ncbi:MAG: VOC family protein [Leptolyngbyaceae cyanobacterium]